MRGVWGQGSLMAIYSSSIKGLDETIIAFKKLTEDKANSFVVAGSERAANVILEKAKQLVSVDTGTLKDSLEVKQVRAREDKKYSMRISQPVFTIGPKSGTYENMNLKRNRAVRYGHIVELGTREMRARPYLRPAADTSKEEVISIVVAALNRAMEEFGDE